MKSRLLLPLLLLFAMFNLPVHSSSDVWKPVDEALSEGLPRTAIKQLHTITETALATGDYGTATRAIARRIRIESEIEGDNPAERVRLVDAAINEAPGQIRPLLRTLRAWWVWNFYQQNQYRIIGRTATERAPGEDIEAWDLPRILAEVSASFDAALAAADQLKAIPASDFYTFLQRGSLPEPYRPTLFDVVANEALDFYSSAEQITALPQDAFVLQADSPALDDVAGFLEWTPETTDITSADVRIIRLYQDLLRFHREREDPSAFLDVNLARIVWAMENAAGEEATARGRAALERFIEENRTHEISALALQALAKTFEQENPALSHSLAMRGAEAFPESRFGQACLHLAKSLEVPSLRIDAERVWNAAGAEFSATYRNLSDLHFRLIPIDWLKLGGDGRYADPERPTGEVLDSLIAREPTYTWKVSVTPTPDFRERTQHLTGPENVVPGFYLLVASARPHFGKEDNQISTAPIWVSDLALITRGGQEGVDGLVLHALSGEPIHGAEVGLYRHNSQGRLVRTARLSTNKDGSFRLKSSDSNRQGGYVLATANIDGAEHRLSSLNQAYPGYSRVPASDPRRVFFFTDRSLYRPGQAVRFKGVVLHTESYQTLPGVNVKVSFFDPNRKEVDTLEVTTGERGGFSGFFTAPTDRVTGIMSIEASNLPTVAARVHVEEYKRPRFFAEVNPPSEPPQLGGVVRIQGVARTYTDTPVDGAQVSYRVTREVEWPGWFRFFYTTPETAQEIAHGTAMTDAEGKFEITFHALPSPGASPEGEPVFTFAVRTDVTDGAGETRSAARFVRIGYTTLRATISADEWQTSDQPIALTTSLMSLDGESRDGSAILRIFELQEPTKVQRPLLQPSYMNRQGGSQHTPPDLSNPENWESGKVLAEFPLRTEGGIARVETRLPTGLYRASVEAPTPSGRPATTHTLVRVIDPKATTFPVPLPHQFVAQSWQVEPGETFTAVWGTGYAKGRVFVEFVQDQKILKAFWTDQTGTQQRIEFPIMEEMRGGVSLRLTFVHENRAFIESRVIRVPWRNKELTLRWEHLTSKLQPGASEKWTALIEGPDAQAAAAEMVATLYDASLDQFMPHQWMASFPVLRSELGIEGGFFHNTTQYLSNIFTYFEFTTPHPIITRTQFDPSDTMKGWIGRRGLFREAGGFGPGIATSSSGYGFARGDAPEAIAAPLAAQAAAGESLFEARAKAEKPDAVGASPAVVDPSTVVPRQNLEETAFFFPSLTTDEEGRVRFEFKMPEALTTWRFMGFAHDSDLRAGLLQGSVVTAKDIMVQPNPPRFLREGDTVEFTVKISNRSERPQTGNAQLTFLDAESNTSADALLGITSGGQAFEIPANSSRTLSWRITVPDGCGFLIYRATATTGDLSDGEEGWLPVLSRRILVTESLPLPIRGPAERTFTFQKLLDSDPSDAFETRNLVAQMTSNPAWYAVMALPYLMEFPYECNEQIFHRFYANSLARHIARSDPKMEAIFVQWRNTDALESPLSKNEEIKGLAVEETPWLREATNEAQARRNVGLLFAEGRIDREIAKAFGQLEEAQYPDGTWPWFPGGQGNDFITLTIVTGFGRMHHLGLSVQLDPAIRAIGRLDNWIVERYRELQRSNQNWKEHIPTPEEALYLYARSFFLKHRPIPPGSREAVDFYLGQGRALWLKTQSRLSQGHLALALQRFGERETPAAILASLKERAVTHDELGMYWKDHAASWWWHRAPIETQSLLIEAFDEIAKDQAAVEELRIWLLKQKQTQDWKTTKATAEAVYALLLRGSDILASNRIVEMSLGGIDITPQDDDPGIEAGTGTFERRFAPEAVLPAMGNVRVVKRDEGIAWGALHWQYLADIGHVTPHEETPLSLKKTVFLRENSPRGPVLREIRGPLAPGDELLVRIELRTDRAMEYVHLKDQRGSGTEPVNVLSGRRTQDGLSYYESTRDTATHFFIDYLPAGTYVFEYPLRVQLRGVYQSGIAEVMCMYAPEFNSHSASTKLSVE